MPRATRSDLELAFGKHNVEKWADVNNNRLVTEIDARVTWAIEEASAELDARLGHSVIQLADLTGPPWPRLVVRLEAYLAALLLYESRGISDAEEGEHQLRWVDQRVKKLISAVHLGQVKLDVDAPVDVTEAPFVVND